MKFTLRASFLAILLSASSTFAQLPGGRPEDAQLAIQNPDEYAWKLFLALNIQAAQGTAGVPEPEKDIRTYADDRAVVWETWAQASGGRAGRNRTVPNRSEVFLDKGAAPVPWESLKRETQPIKNLEPLTSKHLEFLSESGLKLPRVANVETKGSFHIMVDPTLPERADQLFEGGPPTGDEVRMNRSTFEFVRTNKLYSIEGLEAAFSAFTKSPSKLIAFPNNSQEVKAQWVKISDADKNRYHWRMVKNSKGQDEIWGLTGLHIITRDLPNWFWCDFEHEDFIPWAEVPASDRTTRGDDAPSRGAKDGIRKEVDGTKWQHYRLRGTQNAFTDSRGFFTVVANSQIEKGFQQTSSCITCHARATAGLRSSDPLANPNRTYSLPVFEISTPFVIGSVGTPKMNWFVDEFSRPRFIQTDFLWSLPFRACSEKETPPTSVVVSIK